MTYVCNYSILRFLPYPETGEFVNIGIVLLASNGEFRYKIAPTRQRVTRFFPTLDYKVYLRARNEVDQEFARLSGFFAKHRQDMSVLTSTFRHLIHPRETMMRFSAPGTITTDNTSEELEALFEHYVNHSFATKEYQEKVLERQLGQLLTASNLKQRYTEQRLGNSDYDVRFPFVMMDEAAVIQAIKPVFLGQNEPGKIYEHGDAWVSKVRRLQSAQKLALDTLFIAEPPGTSAPKLLKAYNEVTDELVGYLGVRVVRSDLPNGQLVHEIRRGIPDTRH
ncbi:DUF3037 domain-containing protein [Stutzerimonas nitrititolerans]|uniref:DUF3037 domain-containing protein n=1 Tax=Stutzerimonas nitrititolerans TaxID=2482751 RepID=UPI0028AE2A21|nr:DUF3037 domain-containing protein [Stutzerimonas nitrititolerans]